MTPLEALKQFEKTTGLKVAALMDEDTAVWWRDGAATFECTVGDRHLHIDELAEEEGSNRD